MSVGCRDSLPILDWLDRRQDVNGMNKMDRKRFLASAAAIGIGATGLENLEGAVSPVSGTEASGARPFWPGYDEAIVVDFLASPGYFNYPLNPPLNGEMIQNAVGSGITAVNLTVSGSDFEGTVRKISGWMDRIERFPGALMQVRTLAQLNEAKASGRLGIVFGFQDTTPFEGGLDHIATWNASMFDTDDMAEAFAAQMEKRDADFPDLWAQSRGL